MDTRTKSTRILMLPWPSSPRHITPFLSLAKSLANRNFIIYICSTHPNLSPMKSTLSEKHSISIKLVQLHLPPTSSHNIESARPAFSTLLQTLKPDLLIYDHLLPWAPVESLLQSIPPVLFFATGAYHDQESVIECVSSSSSSNIVLFNSFRMLEGKHMDYLSALTGKKFVAVGPLVTNPSTSSSNQVVVKWLDQREENSTVYASIGSATEREIEQVVLGLDLSGYNFVWSVGDELQKVKIENVIGVVGADGDKGMVVVEGGFGGVDGGILGHKSIGGVLSDCDWSSVMGGVYYGVPIIGVPVVDDRERVMNGRLVEEFGVGKVVVRNGEGGLDKEEVGRVVKEVVRDERLRRKVVELREGVVKQKKESVVDGVVEELVAVAVRKVSSCLCPENSMNMLNLLATITGDQGGF